MPERTAKMFLHRCICGIVSVLLALTITVGSTSFATAALGARAMSGPMQDVLMQACRSETSGAEVGQSCDGSQDIPANNAPCPMIGLCVNMGAGMVHFSPMALTDIIAFEGHRPDVIAIRYSRDDIQATGLPADPQFQPPIL